MELFGDDKWVIHLVRYLQLVAINTPDIILDEQDQWVSASQCIAITPEDLKKEGFTIHMTLETGIWHAATDETQPADNSCEPNNVNNKKRERDPGATMSGDPDQKRRRTD